MMKLNTGDLALVHVRKFSTWYRWLFARLIQVFDKAYYHHCVAVIGNCFHEADTTVRERPLDYYDGDRLLILELVDPLTPEERSKYEYVAMLQLRKKYDYIGAMFFQLLYRLLGIWIGPRGNKAERRPFCSEHCLTMIHHVRGYFQDKWCWSPGDVRRMGSLYYRVKWEGVFNHKHWI